MGEAQVEFDLRVLVDPVVRTNTRQLMAAAAEVTCLTAAVGIVFVVILVRPLRRMP